MSSGEIRASCAFVALGCFVGLFWGLITMEKA